MSIYSSSLTSTTPPTKEFSEFQLPESPYDMLARLFWIAVSLLESDYEHEFLLAIKLLEKVCSNYYQETPRIFWIDSSLCLVFRIIFL